jgi:putative copper export protein
VLLFLNQTAILLGKPLAEVFAWESALGVLQGTRFGTLWLWRMALWLLMGVLLLAAPRLRLVAWLATLCGLAMLLPVSMHSHAAVGSDGALSIFSDWIHLVMTALWVGGLAQFLLAIGVLHGMSRRERSTKRSGDAQPLAVTLGGVAAHFSNYARVAVAGLVVTGIYATWHQVNTLEGLTTTFYGRLLGVKLALVAVLLAVAAANLVWTQRRLLAGQAVWVGRLRALVALEVLLTFAILLVVGGMTSINPARSEIALREAAAAIPPAPAEQPVHLVEDVDDLQIHFTITPGWVGNSNFVIQLVNRRDGSPVTDAGLIRMRFERADANLGESEVQIRPEAPAADGVYSTEGANLSAVGEWKLRMTVQRPGEYDAIADFSFDMVEPPPPPPAPVVDETPALRYRTPVFLLSGILAVLCGIYALVKQRFRLLQGASLAGVLLLLLGAAFLLSGLR